MSKANPDPETVIWTNNPIENGDVIKTLDEAAAAKNISAVDFTGGSKAGGLEIFLRR